MKYFRYITLVILFTSIFLNSSNCEGKKDTNDTIDVLVQLITTEKRNAQKIDWSMVSIKRVGATTGYLPFELLAGHSLYYVKKVDSNPPKGFFIQLEGNHKENDFKSLLESDLSKFKTLISGFDPFGFDEHDDPSKAN